jgi:hypothetical protein
MLYVKNNFNEINYTSSIIINKTGLRKFSDFILKYFLKNIPAALLFEKKGSINGTFALRYKS